MDIVDLAKELERLKQTSTDLIAPTKNIHAQPWHQIRASEVKGPVVQGSPNQLRIAIDGYGSYPLTHLGSVQLADKCGIPQKYYEAMLNEGLVDLTADNVNAWLSRQADRRLVRIADGKVRALLSDRYRVLDNYDLAMLTMSRAKDHNATVQESELTESRMYIKLVVPEYKEEIKKGDPIVPGLVVSNSEVGLGAFRVEPFLFRLVCRNGLIGTESLYKVHIGAQRVEIGEVYKDDTKKAMDKALWGQVRDIIDNTFDRDVLKRFVARLGSAQNIPIQKPQEAVDVTAKNLWLSDDDKLSLLRYFAKEGDTVFGLVNGITRLAQDNKNYDERVQMERYAGEVLEKMVVAK